MKLTDDILKRIESVAPQMNAMRRQWFPRLHYDMLADALWWSDERPDFDDAEDHWCLRPVFRYRTTLILGDPDPNYEAAWAIAKDSFPRWPGFHPRRCRRNEKLAQLFHGWHRKAMEEFENLSD